MEKQMIESLATSKQTMSSLEIAELTGKSHSDLMKAIRKMEVAWENVHKGKFSLMFREVEIGNGAKRKEPYYELTKTECLYVATKFNDEARAKLVLRWEQLETNLRKSETAALPDFTNPAEAARAWAHEYEQKCIEAKRADEAEQRVEELESENLQLAVENQELRNDKSYLDLIMRSKALLTISQIAQDYGMSGKAMNKKLQELNVQYSINGQWILYAAYKNKGYVSSQSIAFQRSDGRKDFRLHTYWTQEGRKFLYQLLKDDGIIPMLER